jgi:copper transport protein
MRRAAPGLLIALVVVLASATPAAAHAELRSTEPASSAVLEAAPEQVVLEFSEAVEVSFGAVRVHDGDGRRLDSARAYHPEGRSREVAMDLPPLDRGAYVVTWRVLSADSHPVHGAFTFRIGEAGAGDDNRALAERLLAAQGGSTSVGATYALVRAVTFASLVVLVGGTGFVAALWPQGGRRRAVRRLLGGAWIGAGVSTVAGIGLQGAYAAGLPFSAAFDPDVVAAVLDTRFGRASAARLALLAVSLPLLLALRRHSPRRASAVVQAALVVVGIGVLATPGLAGHASTGELVGAAVAADVVHLAAVSAWLGGLALLTVALLPQGDATELGEVVPRFSRLAFAAVIVILASGLFQSWRQLGGLDALTATTYGRLLAVKVLLFVAMVTIGWTSRSWVRRRYRRPTLAVSAGPGAAAAPPGELSRLRRSVGTEVAAATAVLVVTALLVNAIPGRTALALPYSAELEAGELLVDVTVDPAKAGPLDLHLYTLTPAGLPAEIEELSAELQLPAREISPIDVPLQRAGPNHFVAYAFDVPIPGEWQLEVVARTSDVDEERATATIPIR